MEEKERKRKKMVFPGRCGVVASTGRDKDKEKNKTRKPIKGGTDAGW